MTPSRWPEHRFTAVPSAIRSCVGTTSTGRLSLARVAEAARLRPTICSFATMASPQIDTATSRRALEALLVPRAGGFDVMVNSDPPKDSASPITDPVIARRRARFRLAHEIGHSFFYDRRPAVPVRCAPGSDAEERFCDLFASVLLIPSNAIPEDPTPHDLRTLSSRFDVSLEVASRAATEQIAGRRGNAQMALVSPAACTHEMGSSPSESVVRQAKSWPLSVAYLTRRANPRTRTDVDWRVEWVTGAWAPRHARLYSQTVDTAGREGWATGFDHLQSGRIAGCYRVQAHSTPGSGRMLAVLRLLTVAPSSEQQPLSSPTSHRRTPSPD
jgi:hypothetical protein